MAPGSCLSTTAAPVRGVVVSHDPKTGIGSSSGSTVPACVTPGDIARWSLCRASGQGRGSSRPPPVTTWPAAPLPSPLSIEARAIPELRHFGVLLTRAEEVGFVGAIHAAKAGTVPGERRLLSIEASRASTEAPVGCGPVVRVGDASTVFDQEMTNLMSRSGLGRWVAPSATADGRWFL